MTTFAPEAACEGSLRHGGKASRGKTYSKYITRHQARNLLEALSFADERGLRLNVAVDICWPMFSGFVDDRTRFARCQQRLSKWAKRRGFALTLIWTRELGKYGSPHTHVLIHVPPWLMESNEFQFALERALEPEGGPNHEKAIMIQPAYAPRGKLLYNLKGLHPREAKRFGVRPSYQGDLSGKRAGCTENIGSGARRKAPTREVRQSPSWVSKQPLWPWPLTKTSKVNAHDGRAAASKFCSTDTWATCETKRPEPPARWSPKRSSYIEAIRAAAGTWETICLADGAGRTP